MITIQLYQVQNKYFHPVKLEGMQWDFRTVERVVQYCGGSSVLWRDNISTVRYTIFILEDLQYCRGYHQDCVGGINKGYHQYYGGCSVLQR